MHSSFIAPVTFLHCWTEQGVEDKAPNCKV